MVQRTYSATLDVQSDVADEWAALLGPLSASEDVRDRALLIATELFSNSVEHSCAYDASQSVTIRAWKLPDDGIGMQVEDTGSGFDRLPDPDLPPDPLSEGGRGLFLLHQLTQRVVYKDAGRIVDVEFHAS
jgi:serine/threonine-protein kinase RsbW